ncbi:MAG: hypothetical protein H6620_12625 [Halobacteriovoraceae bacterium]|nr:hypothetical protein [Halobacteriovoraceae bacterium]
MSEVPNPIRKEYMAHIDKQKLSGLSIKKYCEQNNLIEHKFSYYRNYKPKPQKLEKPHSSFVPVKIVETKLPKSRGNIDPVWLAKFVKSVME